jgi:hypothetical protein
MTCTGQASIIGWGEGEMAWFKGTETGDFLLWFFYQTTSPGPWCTNKEKTSPDLAIFTLGSPMSIIIFVLF